MPNVFDWLRAEFDRHELQIYEEVAKMPPFQRKTLVLIGAQGVGRRSLKNRLVVLNPTRFGATLPCESTVPFLCSFIMLSLFHNNLFCSLYLSLSISLSISLSLSLSLKYTHTTSFPHLSLPLSSPSLGIVMIIHFVMIYLVHPKRGLTISTSSHISPQSPHGVPVTTSWTATRTASWVDRRWKQTWGRAVSWSMASTTGTSTARR